MTNYLRSPHQLRIDKFMELAGQALPPEPTIPNAAIRTLRAKLILEEALETILGLGIDVTLHLAGFNFKDGLPVIMDHCQFNENQLGRKPDLIAIADGCADVSVVTIGTLSACGISDVALLHEVDRSNLAKFTGDAHRREDGKWIKSSDWVPPDIQAILDSMRTTDENVEGYI